MSELDQMWSEILGEAMAAARASGRHDVADYLDLKARNDALREAGVQWLLTGLIAIASEGAREYSSITIDRDEPHSFPHRGANIVGSRIIIRHGVRCLTVEAGWTRTPADGFMRGGSLAIARITHFGLSRMNADLSLKAADEGPGWTASYPDGASIPADESFLRQHFSLLIGD